MFLNQLLNAVFQVVLFSVIPLVWWFVTARKKENFFKWLGIKRPVSKDVKNLILSILAIIVVCFLVGELAIWMRGDVAAAESAYKGMGLAAKFGFNAANIIQALIFGGIHLTMVWGQVGVIAGIVIVIYPMIPAVAFAYLNEKKADGSILPSWIAHGTLNTISTLFSLF